MEQVTITATMADGSTIVERVGDFGAFAALVLGFRADPDCRRLVWALEESPAAPQRAAA